MTFASLGLPTPILKGIKATGHIEPTAIQSKSIPVTLEGNDLIAAVQSGTGKTAAYLLPILARLLDGTTRLRAVVLVPTRELAAYVETRARDYARYSNLQIGVTHTGEAITAQEKRLRDEPIDMLVAMPSRLIELHERGAVNVQDVELLVFDEADRMIALEMGTDLRRLLKILPETRQTLMFSLTMPPELNRLAKDALIEPVRVDLGPSNKPAAGITQAIYPVPRDLKADLLDELLARMEVRATMVITRTRHQAVRLARFLSKRFTVAVLDEHPSQSEREAALGDLRRGRMQIIVASATSARSLDTADLAHVFNFDVPEVPEDYVHLLGRTGRGEPVGDVFTLMSPEEQREVAAIERFLGRTVPRVMLPDFDYSRKPREFKPVLTFGDDFFDPAKRKEAGVRAAANRIAAKRAAESARNGAAKAAKAAANVPPAKSIAKGAAKTTAKPTPKATAKASSGSSRSAAATRTRSSSTRHRAAKPSSARGRTTPKRSAKKK